MPFNAFSDGARPVATGRLVVDLLQINYLIYRHLFLNNNGILIKYTTFGLLFVCNISVV